MITRKSLINGSEVEVVRGLIRNSPSCIFSHVPVYRQIKYILACYDIVIEELNHSDSAFITIPLKHVGKFRADNPTLVLELIKD